MDNKKRVRGDLERVKRVAGGVWRFSLGMESAYQRNAKTGRKATGEMKLKTIFA